MSPLARIVLIVVLAAAAVGAYRWWNSPERQIHRVLAGLAEDLSHDQPATGVGAVTAVAGLQQYFAVDVVVEPGGSVPPLTGRDAVLGAAARLYAAVPSLQVEFVDVRIDLGTTGTNATVDCTASARVSDRGGQPSVDAREVIMTLRVIDGRWVIDSARAVQVLEPVL